LKFYNGFLYNPESNVTLLAITLKKEKLDSKERIPLVNSIEQAADAFGKNMVAKCIIPVCLTCALL